jgi:osmoprotectant transport system permease protein
MIDAIGNLYDYIRRGFEYIFQHWDRVAPRFGEHLQLTGISLLIGLLIALPVGFGISRMRWLATPVLGVLNILYSIPGLAFLALLVPFFGLGPTTTIVMLVIYSQTMLVRNTALGFNGIDPAILEAARGMGMSKAQTFWRVELPLAVPIIIAGMRIATLATISIATIGALVGAGGLGKLIVRDPTNYPVVSAAIICIVFMAIVADQVYRLIEREVAGYRYKKVRPNSAKINIDKTFAG